MFIIFSEITAGTHNDMCTRGFHNLITAGTHTDVRTRRFPTRK